MKKINYILLALAIIILPTCKKLENDGINPNSPNSVSPGLMLRGAEIGTVAVFTLNLSRSTNILTQHLIGTDQGQYAAPSNYTLREDQYDNDWTSLYQGTMVNCNKLSKEQESSNPYIAGIAQVLLAMNLGAATDLWGDVPYSEAFLGEGNLKPKADKQEDVIKSIQSLLDKAIVNLSKNESDNLVLPYDYDYFYGGDANKWKTAAYMLKARYAMRLTGVKGNAAASEALGYLSSAGLVGNSDDMNIPFDGVNGSTNSWAAFEDQRGGYIRMGKYFIDILNTTSDPRISFFATEDASGGYSGNSSNDISTDTTSTIGSFFSSSTSSMKLLSYSEMKFIEAEAELMLGNTAPSQNAFEDAVAASVEDVTGAPDAAFVSSVTGTLDIENIITQKYVALFTQLEPYNDFRRTGYPSITPNPDAATPSIPKRFPTPQIVRANNPNAISITDLSIPVWWDR